MKENNPRKTYISRTRTTKSGHSIDKIFGNLFAYANTFEQLLHQLAILFGGVRAQSKDGRTLAYQHRCVGHDAHNACLLRQQIFHRLECYSSGNRDHQMLGRDILTDVTYDALDDRWLHRQHYDLGMFYYLAVDIGCSAPNILLFYGRQR